MGRGHSGENSISGKTGIHFKISAQKGQQGCSQARQGPQFPQFFPRGLQPQGGPWPESAVRRQGQRGSVPTFSERSGCGEREGVPAGRLSWTALRALPACPAPRSHLCWRDLGTARRVGKETRVNASVSTSEQLLRWERESQAEKGLPSPEARRDWWEEVERGWQEGASEPRGRRAHL